MEKEFLIPGNHSNVINDLRKSMNLLDSRRQEIAYKISQLENEKARIRPPQKTRYTLKGVIIHEGTVSYGHYYSYVKVDGQWVCFDDLQVEEVSEETVIKTGKGFTDKKSANCYCLVYLKGKSRVIIR